MFAREILSEQDFIVTGDPKTGFKVIGPGGTVVDTGKYRGEAERKASRLDKQFKKSSKKCDIFATLYNIWQFSAIYYKIWYKH